MFHDFEVEMHLKVVSITFKLHSHRKRVIGNAAASSFVSGRKSIDGCPLMKSFARFHRRKKGTARFHSVLAPVPFHANIVFNATTFKIAYCFVNFIFCFEVLRQSRIA